MDCWQYSGIWTFISCCLRVPAVYVWIFIAEYRIAGTKWIVCQELILYVLSEIWGHGSIAYLLG